MIASCPKCRARYRVSREKLGPHGAKLRCSRCEVVFRVQPQPADPATSVNASAAAPAAQAKGVLVVEVDPDAAKAMADFAASWGLQVEVLHDGAEGLLSLHRKPPVCAILGGNLPSLSGPAIAEIVRRTSELRSLNLIRIVPMGEPVGAPEFEANFTLEPGDLPDGLGDPFEKLGLGRRPPKPQAPAPVEPAAAARKPAASPKPASSPAESTPEIAAAERLARIIISDIILYNEEKFSKGREQGDVVGALAAELEEASGLFRQRIPDKIRERRDFLVEELERRAARSAK